MPLSFHFVTTSSIDDVHCMIAHKSGSVNKVDWTALLR